MKSLIGFPYILLTYLQRLQDANFATAKPKLSRVYEPAEIVLNTLSFNIALQRLSLLVPIIWFVNTFKCIGKRTLLQVILKKRKKNKNSDCRGSSQEFSVCFNCGTNYEEKCLLLICSHLPTYQKLTVMGGEEYSP